MGWFNKKEQQKRNKLTPSLPNLPELPELPSLDYPMGDGKSSIPQLPSFPNSSLGQKFSQDTIKQAVTGKKEGDKGDFDADEYEDEKEIHRMPNPRIQKREETPTQIKKETPYKFKETTTESEPLFIRIDKFKENLQTFEKAKEKISEIGHMLLEIKKIKDEEEQQLNTWERQMQIIKEQIEKIDKELFSKI